MPFTSVSRHFLRVLVVLGFGLIGAVLAGSGVYAQDGSPTSTPPAPLDATPLAPLDATPSAPPQSCAECHLDVVAAWETGLHAKAYSDPIFQEMWQEQGQDVTCLECHTTGFNPRTGEFAHEGVTCEACHGQTPAEHPPEPVMINPGVETCETCHATTVNEWEISAHGEQQLACTTCHNPHPQELRFETANALCLNCHDEDARDDYAHLVHTEQQCVECHWFRADLEDLQAHYESGALFPTGHSGIVETTACIDCHAEITDRDVMDLGQDAQTDLELLSEHPLLEAQVRIEELEAEVDTARAQGANSSALRMVQGLIVGVVLGGIVVASVARFRRRTDPMQDHDTAAHTEEHE